MDYDKLVPWSLWTFTVPNEHANDPEDAKRRPCIIVSPYFDVDEIEDEEDLKDFYPDYAVGTSEVEKYETEPGAFVIDDTTTLNQLGLKKPTVFRFSKVGKDYLSLSAYDIINDGKFISNLSPTIIKDIKRVINNDRRWLPYLRDIELEHLEKIQEDINDTYYIDDNIKDEILNNNDRYGWLDNYEFAIVDLEEIIKKNNLDNEEHGMYSRHLDIWPENRDLYHYKFDNEDWLYSPIRVYSNLKIQDGNHRIWALYNDGYKYAEVLMQKPVEIDEQLLSEKTRSDLLNKSKAADNYSKGNQSKGKNRFERRKYSKISNTIKDYNNIDMNALWKGDILEFKIKVQGETNNYEVLITFEDIIKNLQEQVKANKNKLEFKCVLKALLKSFNSNDIYVSCSCEDFKYTQAYWGTKQRYNSGKPQTNNGKWIRNPNDSKGGGCKHILLVLSNVDWMMKIASVINNYVKYSKNNLQRLYADFIFPKIYGVPYNKAVQLSLFDDLSSEDSGLLPDDAETMNAIINHSLQGKDAKGKFTKDNPYKFTKKNTKETEEKPKFKKEDSE